MNALSGKGVQHHGQRSHKGLAFAGLHFRDLAGMKHHAAHKLHVVMAHPHDSGRRLADQREDFRQHVVQRTGAALHFVAVFRELRRNLLVGKLLHLGFKRVALSQLGTQRAKITFIAGAEYFADQEFDHGNLQKKSLEQGRT